LEEVAGGKGDYAKVFLYFLHLEMLDIIGDQEADLGFMGTGYDMAVVDVKSIILIALFYPINAFLELDNL